MRIDFAGVTLDLAEGWFDITDDLPPGTPPTLARSDGNGALQFSKAAYSGGAIPGVRVPDLLAMAREFGAARGLGVPTSLEELRAEWAAIVEADYSTIRDGACLVWYVTDGRSVALVSYVTDGIEASGREIAEARRMVSTIAFP